MPRAAAFAMLREALPAVEDRFLEARPADRIGSDRIGSDRFGPDRIVSDRVGWNRIGSERVQQVGSCRLDRNMRVIPRMACG